MTILVTGIAGFIGSHVAERLLALGQRVIGVDNLNDYYEVSLKEARLARVSAHPKCLHYVLDIADRSAMEEMVAAHPEITHVVHLAAQAGVRYSLENPFAYVHSNLIGHMVVLECCRRMMPRLQHLVYASSSSVYGGGNEVPFSVADSTDHPLSLYAATKKSDELLTHSYSHLYGIPATGLRFFTVYGPWGRPDMAPFLFTRAILNGEPITLFNHGKMRRDFTYIDDIVAGVLAVLDAPSSRTPPHGIYNLGNHRAETLEHFVETIERATGRNALRTYADLQPGDMLETYADIETSQRDFGFLPRTRLEEGIPRFVAWFREYYGI